MEENTVDILNGHDISIVMVTGKTLNGYISFNIAY